MRPGSPQTASSSISKEMIIALSIGLGIGVLLTLILVVACLLIRKRRRQNQNVPPPPSFNSSNDINSSQNEVRPLSQVPVVVNVSQNVTLLNDVSSKYKPIYTTNDQINPNYTKSNAICANLPPISDQNSQTIYSNNPNLENDAKKGTFYANSMIYDQMDQNKLPSNSNQSNLEISLQSINKSQSKLKSQNHNSGNLSLNKSKTSSPHAKNSFSTTTQQTPTIRDNVSTNEEIEMHSTFQSNSSFPNSSKNSLIYANHPFTASQQLPTIEANDNQE